MRRIAEQAVSASLDSIFSGVGQGNGLSGTERTSAAFIAQYSER